MELKKLFKEEKNPLNFNTVEFNTNSKVKALYNDPTIDPLIIYSLNKP